MIGHHTADALERRIRAYMARDKTPTIEDVRSLSSLKRHLPKDQERKLKVVKEIQALMAKRAIQKAIEDLEPKRRKEVRDLEKEIQVRRMTLADLPRQLRDPFYGLPGVKGTMCCDSLPPLVTVAWTFSSVKVAINCCLSSPMATFRPPCGTSSI